MVPTHAATTPMGLSIAPVSVITAQLQALSTFIQRRAKDVKVSGGRRECSHKKDATQSHMQFFFCYATHQVTVQCRIVPFFFFFSFPPFFQCVDVTQPHDVMLLQVLGNLCFLFVFLRRQMVPPLKQCREINHSSKDKFGSLLFFPPQSTHKNTATTTWNVSPGQSTALSNM